MSHYLNIFMQDEDGNRINICNFHRSHPVYDALYDIVPWGDVVSIDWQKALVSINKHISCLRDEARKQEERIQRIQNCNNTLNEKIHYIDRYASVKASLEDTLKEQDAVKSYIELLMTISETTGKKIVAGIEAPMEQNIECEDSPIVAD